MAIAAETNKSVKRIDARDVKRGKRQREIDRQEKCYAYWEMGRAKESVKSAAKNGKVTYANVFEYFRRELEAMGIKSAAKFTLAINRRAKRLSKRRTKGDPFGGVESGGVAYPFAISRRPFAVILYFCRGECGFASPTCAT